MPVVASRMSALMTMSRNLIATSIRDSPGITVLTSSNPLQIAKNILKKSCQEDLYLAVLAYRNTPQQGHAYSPETNVPKAT